MTSSPIQIEESSQNPDDLHETLLSLEVHSKLAESSELARSGSYGEAEELLKTIKNWQSLPPALDLLARISAQQGKLAEASKYWEKAIELSPGNLSYQAGLAYVTKSTQPVSGTVQFFTWFLRGMGIIIIGGLLFLMMKQFANNTPPSQTSDNMQMATLQAQVLGLYVTPSVPTDMPVSTPTSIIEPASPPNILQEIPINVIGLNTVLYDDALIVYPEKDMFDYNWRFSADTRVMITELGSQLEPYSGEIDITLVGFKQNSEESDFFDIGLTRSSVVFSWIQNSTKLPADIFVIMPLENFLRQPYAPVLEDLNNVNKYVLFLIQVSR